MMEIFEHIKRVAIADFKLFFEPYVWVGSAIRRGISSANRRVKNCFTRAKNQDDE